MSEPFGDQTESESLEAGLTESESKDSESKDPESTEPRSTDPESTERTGGRRSWWRQPILPAAAMSVILALYYWQMAARAVALIGSGEFAGVAIGAVVLIIPTLAVAFAGREWLLAWDVQRMADALAARGDLPVDELPRSPGGRIDRTAALAAFEEARAETEAAGPQDWGSWYRLAFAYDAAGDRKRARAALRVASRIHRGRGGPADLS